MPKLPLLVILVASVLGCTADRSDVAVDITCEQTVLEANPLLGPMEARAESSSPEIEAWALFFPAWEVQPGDALTLPVGEEIKIVWKVTGDGGDPSFRAVAVSGEEAPLVWGPNSQGSSWGRPGDEHGTGWLLPDSGCWILEVQRGEDVHSLVALVE